MKTVAAQMKPAADVRLVEVADANSNFASGEPLAVQPSTVTAIAEPVLEFLGALQCNKMAECKVPHAIPPGQPPVVLSETAAQGIAAQIAVLDEDDSIIYEVEPYGNAPPGNGNPAASAAAAAGVNGQQQTAQQILQQQAAAQLQLQQAQLAAVMAAKSGMPLQAAAAAAQRAGGIPAGVTASSGLVAPVVMPAGIALTPQVLAAAQAMAAAQQAAANQGVRPAVASAAAHAAAQQQ